MINSFSLKRNKMVKSKKQFTELFINGEKIFSHPVLISYLFSKPIDQEPFKIAFSVGKKKVKKAVNRIRIKRLLREAFRLNQNLLNPILKTDSQLIMLIIFVEMEETSYESINGAVYDGLKKLVSQNVKKNTI